MLDNKTFTLILFIPQGEGVPTVIIACAGRSNGLGPVLAGNTAWPVINCPPVNADWGSQDVWSSLRLPSGKCDSGKMQEIVVEKEETNGYLVK